MPVFSWPTLQRYVSSGFDARRYYGYHNAIDIPAPLGSPIVAAAAGQVRYAGAFGDCGLNVQIDTPDGWRLHHCHLNFIRVTAGQQVTAGQPIGDVGSTGVSSGPHLHFGIYATVGNAGARYVPLFNKWAVDPLLYLGQRKEFDMIVVRKEGQPEQYVVAGSLLIHIADQADRDRLLNLGAIPGEIVTLPATDPVWRWPRLHFPGGTP